MKRRRVGMRVFVASAALSLGATGLGVGIVGVASAATLDVGCDVSSLVSAIQQANGASGPTTLNLAGGCTYALTQLNNSTNGGNGLPVITTSQPVTIEGNASTITRNPSAPAFRILQVGSGANVSINQLAITGGLVNVNGGCRVFLAASCGGGVLVLAGGTLRVTNGAIVANTVSQFINPTGGGIANLGTLSLVRSVVRGNHATTSMFGGAPVGAGIWNGSTGSVHLNTTSVTRNSIVASQGAGARLSNEGGTVTMQTTSVSSNGVNASGGHGPLRPNARASGGGIQNDGNLTATSVVIRANSVTQAAQVGPLNNVACGGGIDGTGTLNLNGSQVLANHVGGGANGFGGGIGYAGRVTLTATDVRFNSASTDGGGVNRETPAGTLTIVSGAVADNMPNDFAAATC